MKITPPFRFILIVSILISTIVFPSKVQQLSYAPNADQIARAYKNSDNLDSTLRNLPTNNDITPFWNKDNSAFWYKKNLPDRNWEYIYVDVASGKRVLAFDQLKFSQSLAKATGSKQNPNRLPLSEIYFEDQQHLKIKVDRKWYLANLIDYSIIPTQDSTIFRYSAKRPLQRKRSRWEGGQSKSESPDGKNKIKVVGGNIVLVNVANGEELTLTTEGTVDKPFGNFEWAPDGKNIVVYKIDPKEIKKVHYVLSSVPGTTRGVLKSREYAQPGDDFTSFQPYVINLASRKLTMVDIEATDFFSPTPLHWRNNSARYYTYEKADRGHQRFRVIEVDVQTGKTRNIIDEKTKTFIYESRIYTRYLSKTNEIIWSSEQDGWQHLYLVDALTGKQQLITKGNYVVRDVDSVDVIKRQVWFKAGGMNPDEDPYFLHYCRIGFNGKGLVNLTPEIGNHVLTFSPDRKHYIDTYSQVNVPPVTKLKQTDNGKQVMEMEHGDVAPFINTGVKLPEVFVAKGRDSKTDIWGVICFPSKMDPSIKYPIIENIYAGPQDSFVPKSFLPASEMQSIAELGFIVVQIDGMGTANRSKAFHDVCWQNLADAGFPDRILWMKAMAKKYPNANIEKIGVYGTSAGGQNSTGALLFHPEFYKVAVSACGCHDNRIDKQWWNEQWMGYPVGPHYAAQSNITNASKLQGDLFLIVGEADENVPPESTYRLADALIKANKDFDILSIPGMGHSDGGVYGRLRKRDFFVRHLLNAIPPARNHTPAP